MKIAVISVGKKHDAALASAIQNYSARIEHFAQFEWIIIPESGLGKLGIAKESATILSKINARDIVVVLDESGMQLTSRSFSSYIEQGLSTAPRIVFVIGGAYGVSDELLQSAQLVLGLGKFTFPHQLVRLLLTEQIYRAFAIAKNLPYHHD